MISLPLRLRSVRLCLLGSFAACSVLLPLAGAQQEKHGRGYKAPPPTATVGVTVEKAANGKPLPNASVIFRAVRNEDVSANMEMKTDPDGHATLDLLEVGSHVTVQVIANGYATYASDFDLATDGKQILVKLQRPRAQVSLYGEDTDRPAEVTPGVQEWPKKLPAAPAPGTAPTAAPPVAPSPTTPLKTTPPVATPGATPGAPAPPSTTGTPQ